MGSGSRSAGSQGSSVIGHSIFMSINIFCFALQLCCRSQPYQDVIIGSASSSFQYSIRAIYKGIVKKKSLDCIKRLILLLEWSLGRH